MATATRKRKTVDDYMRLPADVRVELIGGDFYMSPSPEERHQRAVAVLTSVLLQFAEAGRLGRVYCAPFDCILSRTEVVQPDVLFVAAANLGKIRKRLHGAPDLAVEVLSPENAERDRIVKRDLYRKHGVREYWIVDPEERTVEVLSLRGKSWRLRGIFEEGDELRSPLLPGLKLSVRKLFE